jgi:hypothetical protein
MVLRTDPQGRRWKVPHNFYRVKDHGDDFTLGTPHVLRVAELAAADRAVYRYVRRVFSPKFSPIDGANVWTQILPEVRRTPVWQELAARTEQEETRASARTKAGHAARKGGGVTSTNDPDFFVPGGRDETATPAEDNDSGAVTMPEKEATSVASINTGFGVDVAGTNRGSRSQDRSDVGATNTGDPTSVAPTNTTYDESRTTTKRPGKDEKQKTTISAPAQASETMVSVSGSVTTGGPGAQPPMDAAAQMAALRAFEQANDRAATPAERKLLRDLAERYDAVAESAAAASADVPGSGWGWLEAAVWEAVEAGSAFVAPRRLREILQRWERDGFPGTNAVGTSRQQGTTEPVAAPTWAAAPARGGEPAMIAEPVNFPIAEVGLSSRQVWAAVLEEMAQRGSVSRADLETWLRPASLIGREGETLLIGAPNAVARDRITTRLLPALREAITATLGVSVEIAVVSGNDWPEQRAAGA